MLYQQEYNKDMAKKLIIAPHADDEALGCGGILDKDSFVYYCGIDESRVQPDPAHRIPAAEREKEVKAVADFLGFQYEIDHESKVNHFAVQEFIGKIENLINRIKPEMIFIPHPGYNQDHQAVFKACQTALRPHDKNFFVKKVLVYEAIHDFIWSYGRFCPNYFIPVDIERKNKAYLLHKSQVRGFRSPEMIESLAKIRGAMCSHRHAEAFQIQRWVE